jgi:nitroreductase
MTNTPRFQIGEKTMPMCKQVIQTIKKRKSCRSFSSQEIDAAAFQKLSDYLAESDAEAKASARFLLVQNKEKDNETPQKLGTYGMVTGANHFIVGICQKQEINELVFGYLFEEIVLFATDLGLQTCWLGGTFKRDAFNQKIQLRESEIIAIVSPVGYRKEKPRLFENAVRAVVGANDRKPWSDLFFHEKATVPLKEDSDDPYCIALAMVRLGPSASNKQPWRVIKAEDAYHFYVCRTKNYLRANYDMQKNDIGISMCHFELTLKELGIEGSWGQRPGVGTPFDWEYITTWTPSDM